MTILKNELKTNPDKENIYRAIESINFLIQKKQKEENTIGYAYYIRGHLQKMMMTDFCDDFIKASELGFTVEEGIIKMCFRWFNVSHDA